MPIAKQPPKFPPYLGCLAPLRCGFNGAQPMPIVSVPLATGCPGALSTMEPASAVLHSRLPAWRASPGMPAGVYPADALTQKLSAREDFFVYDIPEK
jgi:hypothetical protein